MQCRDYIMFVCANKGREKVSAQKMEGVQSGGKGKKTDEVRAYSSFIRYLCRQIDNYE